jgi:hypothetical protein
MVKKIYSSNHVKSLKNYFQGLLIFFSLFYLLGGVGGLDVFTLDTKINIPTKAGVNQTMFMIGI